MVMKKRCSVFALIIFFILGLCSCEPPDYSQSDGHDMFTVAAYSVVGTDEMGVKIELMQTDDYGRKLFKAGFSGCWFYDLNVASFSYVWGVFVLQKSEDEKVFYYEDICFEVGLSEDDFTDEQLEKLKQDNDWGRELDESKMSSRPLCKYGNKWHKYGFGELHYDVVQAAFIASNANIEGNHYTFLLMDEDSEGNQLYNLAVYDSDSEVARGIESYFMILDSTGVFNGDGALMRVENYNYGKQLHNFKIENGWRFD